ncbi:TetR/AcrR family transcriptional regulator [Gordonia sp. X0973]|uniref:TetR/AcrR family transcriptional regulator n=1 Tax=Gordonia sp. X0973 TaxID=2742602 RepID=UPI000F54349B|nr:TetR/AcrR family transcriptional regulator [Gordonia sp. X0973]QKT08790.1 TetR/AcrR family transcriptional regulator [Gordonia sp. X0973]
MSTTESEDTASPRRTAKSEATRARILSAAGHVLADRGYEHTRLSAIADAAGLQAGSLYYYFDSKEELVEEALRDAVTRSHQQVVAAVDALGDGSTAGEKLFAATRSFIDARMEMGSSSPSLIRHYRALPADVRERLRPHLQAFSALWDRLVADAVAEGAIRDDLDPADLHLFVVHTAEQLSKWPERADRSQADLAETMFRLMLTGIVGDAGTGTAD